MLACHLLLSPVELPQDRVCEPLTVVGNIFLWSLNRCEGRHKIVCWPKGISAVTIRLLLSPLFQDSR